jgi:hypothetical protein
VSLEYEASLGSVVERMMDAVAEAEVEVGEMNVAIGRIEDAVAVMDHQVEVEAMDQQAEGGVLDLEAPIYCLAIEAGATLH